MDCAYVIAKDENGRLWICFEFNSKNTGSNMYQKLLFSSLQMRIISDLDMDKRYICFRYEKDENFYE